MAKSNYEKYCDTEQVKKLGQLPKNQTFDETISYIKECQNHFSELLIEGMIYLAAQLYDVTDTQIEKLLKGEEYWL